MRNHRTVADEPGAGAVFDLHRPADGPVPSLRAAIDELSAGTAEPPAVLDCTGLDLRLELPDLAVFTPPPGDRLHYLDRSVDVVVEAGSQARGQADAARVADRGVVVVAPGGTRCRRPVGRTGGISRRTGRTACWCGRPPPRTAAGSRPWPSAPSRPAPACWSPRSVRTREARLDGHDVVLALEPHVLPLPGAIRAAAAAAADPASAVAGRCSARDGHLRSAGGSVFFDRSVALVAGSSPQVRAPWHDYVRPVCWAPGLVAAAALVDRRARAGGPRRPGLRT